MREGTTSRVMTADKPYGEFYGFYSVSLGYFGYTLLMNGNMVKANRGIFRGVGEREREKKLRSQCK
jgi:hypothetical protein